MSTSRLFRNGSDDQMILGCDCGDPTHGGLLLRRDPVGDPTVYIVGLWFLPPLRVGERLRQAWEVLLGRPVSTDQLVQREVLVEAVRWLVAEDERGLDTGQ
jgi:hypothetical protein